MVEVFRTNVESHVQAARLRTVLHEQHPAWRVNFDLEDCDRVLRIQTVDASISLVEVAATLQHHGFLCEPLA